LRKDKNKGRLAAISSKKIQSGKTPSKISRGVKSLTESQSARSRTMRAVKSKNTSPELLVRRLVSAQGYRYRLHCNNLPGCPDLVFSGRRKVVFIHGCWWHGHNCVRGARIPKTNVDYWIKKVCRNRARDIASQKQLLADGWRVITVWECELRDEASVLKRLAHFLQ
jgi:DNA mismatch endonuclease, patch repair protein